MPDMTKWCLDDVLLFLAGMYAHATWHTDWTPSLRAWTPKWMLSSTLNGVETVTPDTYHDNLPQVPQYASTLNQPGYYL